MDPSPSILCPARQWHFGLHLFPSPFPLGSNLITSEKMLPAADKPCSLLGSLIHLQGHAVGTLLPIPCSLTALHCQTDFTTDCLIALRKGAFFIFPFLSGFLSLMRAAMRIGRTAVLPLCYSAMLFWIKLALPTEWTMKKKMFCISDCAKVKY